MRAKRLILPALLCAAMASCTIKEDRGPCPCVLDIYLGDSGDYADRLAVSGWNSGSDRLFLDKIVPDQYPVSYSKKVEKCFMHVSAYCGTSAMTSKGDRLVIPEGRHCDPVWAYRGQLINATGEHAEDHIVLHKQYAVIHIRVELPDKVEGEVVIRAKGNANGFEISTLEPTRGSFHCFAELDEDMHHLVTVPRQHDDSLELEVFLDGTLYRTVKAGELIANSGYSWDKEDLDDIYLSLGLYTPGIVTIGVTDWDTEVCTFTF